MCQSSYKLYSYYSNGENLARVSQVIYYHKLIESYIGTPSTKYDYRSRINRRRTFVISLVYTTNRQHGIVNKILLYINKYLHHASNHTKFQKKKKKKTALHS